MLVHELSDALLGANTVGAGNQDGFFHACDIGGKEAAEAADVRYHTGDHGAYNEAVQIFPNCIFAGMFNFHKADYFEIDQAESEVVKVSF